MTEKKFNSQSQQVYAVHAVHEVQQSLNPLPSNASLHLSISHQRFLRDKKKFRIKKLSQPGLKGFFFT